MLPSLDSAVPFPYTPPTSRISSKGRAESLFTTRQSEGPLADGGRSVFKRGFPKINILLPKLASLLRGFLFERIAARGVLAACHTSTSISSLAENTATKPA